MAISYQESLKYESNEVIIVTFSGRQQGLATLTLFEFTNFLESTFPFYDKLYCRDEKVKWYNHGLTGLTSNIDETTEFLRHKIEGYRYVIFVGASMGGYAAILFGSILNVDAVVAFRPQTFIKNCIADYDPKYEDVLPYINEITKYYIYGDEAIEDKDDVHSIQHCYRLFEEDDNKNKHLKLNKFINFDLKSYKDSGKLKEDFDTILMDILFT